MWATSVFSGKVKLPDRTFIEECLKKQEESRNKDKGAQYPYGSYVSSIDGFAQELRLMPDLEHIKQSDPEIYDYLWNDEVLWSHFLFDKQDHEYFRKMMREVREYKTKVYTIEKSDDQIRQSDIEELFMKNYNLFTC